MLPASEPYKTCPEIVAGDNIKAAKKTNPAIKAKRLWLKHSDSSETEVFKGFILNNEPNISFFSFGIDANGFWIFLFDAKSSIGSQLLFMISKDKQKYSNPSIAGGRIPLIFQ